MHPSIDLPSYIWQEYLALYYMFATIHVETCQSTKIAMNSCNVSFLDNKFTRGVTRIALAKQETDSDALGKKREPLPPTVRREPHRRCNFSSLTRMRRTSPA